MPDIEKLRDLLARVEAAEGEDKVLDEAIWRTLMDKPERGLEAVVGRYTGSLDAAIGLVFKALPRAEPMLAKEGSLWWATVAEEYVPSKFAKTTSLALTSALIRALIAQQEAAHG